MRTRFARTSRSWFDPLRGSRTNHWQELASVENEASHMEWSEEDSQKWGPITISKARVTRTFLLTSVSTLLYITAICLQWSAHTTEAIRASPMRVVNSPQLTVRQRRPPERDLKWPQRQVNVLVDRKSLNESERSVLAAVFKQIEHKTCLHIHRLSPERVNPFMARDLTESDRNFIHIFKSPLEGGSGAALGRQPSMGLSSLGCIRQGRQSLVLTSLAFSWPELVLRYHIMRSLGVDKLERPDGQVQKLLNMLPLNQKITSELGADESRDDGKQESSGSGLFSDLSLSNLYEKSPAALERPQFIALSSMRPQSNNAQDDTKVPEAMNESNAKNAAQKTKSNVRAQLTARSYLTESDLTKIKELYECTDYQNRLEPVDNSGSDDRSESRASDQAQSRQTNSLRETLETTTTTTAKPRDETPLDAPRGLIERNASVNDATKRIVDSLLEGDDDSPSNELELKTDLQNSTQRSECKPLESCPLDFNTNQQEVPAPNQAAQERPMLLKLDDFHAQDPELKQANQMKLSQWSNDTLETYRLMNNPTNLADFWTPQASGMEAAQQQQKPQQQGFSNNNLPAQRPKTEMLISFEQSSSPSKDPVSALASSQILKLCSCTCQTMTPLTSDVSPPPIVNPTRVPPTFAPPATSPSTQWPPFTSGPMPTSVPARPPTSAPASTYPTIGPVIPTDAGPNCTGDDYEDEDCYSRTPRPSWPATKPWPTAVEPSAATLSPRPSPKPSSSFPPTEAPTTTELPTTTATTTTALTTSTMQSYPTPTTSTPRQTTTTTTTTTTSSPTTAQSEQPANSTTTSGQLLAANACDQVEWVRPNKTVYASARIVWDVDRGNQNYFLCNNQMNGELIPGKTHGFSCKISQEGRAFEAHSFNVLTKPEKVNLAWVQKNSESFGRTNFPVIGGYSKQQDPYIVSRCLVKDENNDIIVLIGYINNQGVGWFPFDDIQIECSQYDVLACVS